MKKKLLVLLPSLIALMACGSQAASSSVPVSSSTEESSEPLSIKGYELTKDRDNSKAASYDLKTVITLSTGKTITDLSFSSSDTEVATVDAQGVITRVGFGTASIVINLAKNPSIWYASSFNITFLPEESVTLGKYDNHLDAPQGKDEVYAVIELKAENKFTLTYTAGTVLDTDGEGEKAEYNITAQSAEGTFTVDSLYKFTITTEAFPYKKTFSGMMEYTEGKNPTLKLKVPLTADKLSKVHFFEKDE